MKDKFASADTSKYAPPESVLAGILPKKKGGKRGYGKKSDQFAAVDISKHAPPENVVGGILPKKKKGKKGLRLKIRSVRGG